MENKLWGIIFAGDVKVKNIFWVILATTNVGTPLKVFLEEREAPILIKTDGTFHAATGKSVIDQTFITN